ncbi:hypothetical protein Cgig2_000353 [Carnegiea gigantea]|uniref:Uncharacterized protein n=1 Tax=Carnegiea gigantea TaxID=171969 RepID=A0A9Q1KE11_9CARY|nr:hypothetical protein Cgig2_000353 [Carnegiea gigantea]
MAQVIESLKGPERRRSKFSERKPLNWLPKLKLFGNDFFLAAVALLILKNFSKEQVRARLMIFETRDATPEQVVAEAERHRKEEKQRLAPLLVPCEKKPAISLSVHKHQRTKGRPDKTSASPLPMLGKQEPTSLPLGTLQVGCPRGREKDLQRQLDETLSKAKAEATAGAKRAAQAREQGYQQGHADTLGYLCKEDSYFEAYLHYVDECQWAEEEGRDPEEVEFIPPSGEGDGAGMRLYLHFINEDAMGTLTTRKSTSRSLALSLSPKCIGRQIIQVVFTSYPPKPKMGCTKGTMSHPGCVSFFKQSQVMMLTELPKSIRIHPTIALAIFISTTKGSLCGKAKREASFLPNMIVGTIMRGPCSVVSTD